MVDSMHSILVESLEIKGMKPGLARIQAIDEALGFPSKQFASVHVAGTNGKGSVTTKIAHALKINGKRVGLYTSPHIHTYHERIQINGQPISEERAGSLLKKILLLSQESPSYFELLTALAFAYFAEERVDFAVIETGMGGRFDATNIITPTLAIITSIDYDHMAYLGNTLKKIASEKAGIMKPGVPTLLGPHAQPLSVFEREATLLQSPLFQVQGDFAHFEEENRAIASQALSLLPFPLEKRAIHAGLEALPPCRFQQISEEPTVIVDVAHNPNGINRLFERLKSTFPGKKVRTLAGFSADKEIEKSLEILQKHSSFLHLTHSNHPRLLKLGEPIEEAFEKAYRQAAFHKEILLVCGTFFIMHEALLQAEILSKSM